MAVEPLVAVVVPVYNGAEHLDSALESVERQTYRNWHCIVVDNHSDDATPEIARSFAARDRRFVHQPFENFVNGNENHSRAFALTPEDAAYCKILQADDWFAPTCIERMVELAVTDPAIGVVTSHRRVESFVQLVDVGWPDGVLTGSGTDVLRHCLLNGPEPTGSPTDLLIRADLITSRTPFWDATFWHSDTESSYHVLALSDFGFVPEVLTFNRSQPGSRSSQSTWLYPWGPESMRLLARYGPKVLTSEELGRELRREGTRYARYLFTHGVLRGDARRRLFRDFHSAELQHLREEPGIDSRTARFAGAVKAMLRGRSEQSPDELMEVAS